MTVSAPRNLAVSDDRAQRAGDEGVDDVERRDVDHDPSSAAAAHHLRKLVAELQHLRCR